MQIIPNAHRACYLDNPDVWHQLLFNFIEMLSCH